MELKTTLCPACGRGTPVSDGGRGFCVHCGAAVAAVEPGGDSLFSIGGRLRRAYESYADWVMEHFKNTSQLTRTLRLFFTGGDEFKNHENHRKFFDSVRDLAGELGSLQDSGAISRGDAVGLLRYALLTDHGRGMVDAQWMFLAAEQFYEPLLGLLTPEEAARFYDEYKRLRKKSPGFPVQQQILKRLKSLAKKPNE